MKREKRKKLRRQAKATAVAAIASAGVMVGGVLSDNGETDDAGDFPPPITETVPLGTSGGGSPDAPAAESEEEKKKARRTAARFARLPLGARLLVAAGIAASAWLAASALATLLGAALPAAAAALLGWVLTALSLAAGLLALLKAAFPEKTLRDFVKKKNFRWLLGGAALLAAADALLPIVWTGYSTIGAFLKIAGGAALLGGTLTAAFRAERRREETSAETSEEARTETTEEARRRALAMADEAARHSR